MSDLSDVGNHDQQDTIEVPRRTPRPSHAQRLVKVLLAETGMSEPELATRIGVKTKVVRECRDGLALMPSVAQMKLGALALTLLPERKSLAHRVYAQGQAMLRFEVEGDDVRHQVYPREFFR